MYRKKMSEKPKSEVNEQIDVVLKELGELARMTGIDEWRFTTERYFRRVIRKNFRNGLIFGAAGFAIADYIFKKVKETKESAE